MLVLVVVVVLVKLVLVVLVLTAPTRKEFYIAFMNERSMNGPCCIASSEGGVNIEEVAEKNPDAIVKFPIDPVDGLSQVSLLIRPHYGVFLWSEYFLFLDITFFLAAYFLRRGLRRSPPGSGCRRPRCPRSPRSSSTSTSSSRTR